MDAGAVVNWPSVQPLIWLMLERAGSHDAFQTEYQNKPISEGNPFGQLTFWNVKTSSLIYFGAVDPSLGKAGKGRDPSAILIGGIDRLTGRMDVAEASIRHRLPDIIVSDTIALQREYRCLLWFIEAVQFQEFLRTTLMSEAAKVGRRPLGRADRAACRQEFAHRAPAAAGHRRPDPPASRPAHADRPAAAMAERRP